MGNEIGILGKINPSTKIYRIFPRNRFFELYNSEANALVSPKLWDDPFENVILRARVVTAGGEYGEFGFHEDVYGQCWTLQRASDAMWQIYSRDKDAIRVRTTVGKLLASLRQSSGKWSDATCFIGRVDYIPEVRLQELGRTIFSNGIDSVAIARSLLAKRKAYEHEKEVRLIYIEPRDVKHPGGVYKYRFDARDVIDQVMVDGRVNYQDFLPLKNELMAMTGLPESNVLRSLLYRVPDNFVVEIP